MVEAQLLAIARLNQQYQASVAEKEHPEIEVFGAYTIADSWVFTRANVLSGTEYLSPE
jgi:hypothetical protein